MAEAIKARRPGSTASRPTAHRTGRRCAEDGCSTVISRYNAADHCYRHAPRVFPRLRGVFLES